jgi:FAD:protein FMN transferase
MQRSGSMNCTSYMISTTIMKASINAKTINDNAGIAPVVTVRQKNLWICCSFPCRLAFKDRRQSEHRHGERVLSVWHRYRDLADPLSEDNALANRCELQQAALHTSISSLVLDPDNMTAYLSDPDSSIDLGAVAKGYATELVCDELEAEGFRIVRNQRRRKCQGSRETSWPKTVIPGSSAYRTHVSSTSAGTTMNLIDKVAVVDVCVVTSGWYQRYFKADGKIYHHIIDPATLVPTELLQSRHRRIMKIQESATYYLRHLC